MRLRKYLFNNSYSYYEQIRENVNKNQRHYMSFRVIHTSLSLDHPFHTSRLCHLLPLLLWLSLHLIQFSLHVDARSLDLVVLTYEAYPARTICHIISLLTLSLRNFWHPFSHSVRNYFVDARKNMGMVTKTGISRLLILVQARARAHLRIE